MGFRLRFSEVSMRVILLGAILLLALLSAYLLTNMSEETFTKIFIAIINLIAGIVIGNEVRRGEEEQVR